MPLINCKIHFELNWSNNFVMPNVVGVTALFHNRSVYWNEYHTKIETKNLNQNNFRRIPLDSSFQGVKRLFVIAFNNTDDASKV